MTNRLCPYCGDRELTGRRVQCGASDCVREYERKRHLDWQRAYKARTGTHYAYSMPSRPQRKSNTHCVDCGKPVAWGTTQETRCRTCGQRRHHERQAAEARAATAARRAEYNSRPARARRKALKAATGKPANPRWVFASGRCHRCGEWFVCRVTNFPPQFCTARCAKLDARDRRRAREAGVAILPAQRWKIYKRDDYVCKLCGELVDQKAASGSDLAPTIDHVIPLSLGGAHVPDNWQTAHMLCNGLKSDRLDWNFGESAWRIRECLRTSAKPAPLSGMQSFPSMS